MKLKAIITSIILFLALVTQCQQPFCADSSIRVKYIFDNNGAILFNNPDTAGNNIFTGNIVGGLALMKTTWGDSIIWAKKIIMNGASRTSYYMPDGSIICTGFWGTAATTELLLCKIDANGTARWVKRFRLSSNYLYYATSAISIKNILIANNAIYINALMYFNPSLPNNFLNTITKLDLAGNIIWSKGFKADLPKTVTVIDAPVFYNNTLIFSANGSEQPGGLPPKSFFTITKLNETDGSLLESNAYKTVMDSIGLNCNLINVNPGNSLSIIGNILVRADIFGNFGLTNIIFNTRIDENLNPINNFYYRNNIPLDAGDMYFDFNNQSQHAILSLNGNNPVDKYFVIFDKNDRVQRSRKFTSAATAAILYNTSVNLDNKQNLHFINHYLQAGKLVTEYARISNFAPNGTLGCFGKDTSILTQYPFTIAKQPFTWDNIQSDVLVSNDVPYTEDTAIVTKELVCKIVSYCDSVHIKGPAAACIGQPVRYTVSKNSGCFKNLDWQVDTSFVTIINTEGDSAITIRFTKAFTGYLRAAISDCVVRDSFFVTVLPSPLVKIINRDSLLCPGKKIVLKAKPGFKNYQWQDGSTADTLLVTTPGFYKVRGTDSCGLQSADSITVNNTDISFMLRATQTICRYDTAFIILPPDVSNITWLPAGNGLISNKTLLLYPLQTTTYQIRAERLADCPLTASSKVVIKNCEQVVFLPNAFTPNGDTRNDVFKASAFRPLQSFHLLIYNRYGQKIFETNNLATGWDGNFKGKPQPVGGYTYRCSYQFAGGQPQAEAGYFILIR